MYFYKDENNNIIKSSREINSVLLAPLTETEYNEELEQKGENENV